MRERAALKLRQLQPDIARLQGLKAKINNVQPLFMPVKERKYFKFALKNGDNAYCESMLDVVTWLERELAEPDTLSLQDIDPFYLGYLFGLNVPSLSIPELAAGTYQVNEIRIVSGAEIAAEKIRISSPVGELLFDDIPQSMLPAAVFTPPQALKIPLKFILGSSQIRGTRLASVRCGDLLLIQQYHPQVHVADKRAFGFNLSEEGIMIENNEEEYAADSEEVEEIEQAGEIEGSREEDSEENDEESNEEDSEESSEESNEEDSEENSEEAIETIQEAKRQDNMDEDTEMTKKTPGGFNINNLTMKMNFILHQQDMTVQEISHLHAGSLFTLRPDTEKKVMITINNQVYARGELLQVGDNFAVEVTEIYLNKGKR